MNLYQLTINRIIQCIMMLSLLASASSLAAVSNEQQTILIMGDSLSAAHNIPLDSSWPTLLSHRLVKGGKTNDGKEVSANQWRMVNASISGETTSGGAARLPALIKQHQPDLCVLELGANDGLRGQSLKRMKHNLKRMIKQCQKIEAKILLLGIWLPPNYGEKYNLAFNNVYRDLTKEFNLAFIPFFLIDVAGRNEYMQTDGLHPKANAQPLILETVWKGLSKLLVK